MNKFKLLVASGVAMLATAAAHAQATGVDALITHAEGISTSASGVFLPLAGLSVGALVIGTIAVFVKIGRRGGK
jgi:hypothetical protein